MDTATSGNTPPDVEAAPRPFTPEEIARFQDFMARVRRRSRRRSFIRRWFERLTLQPFPFRPAADPFPNFEAERQRDRRAELADLRELRRSLPPDEIEAAAALGRQMAAMKRRMRAGGG
jgi:hypothetical protein